MNDCLYLIDGEDRILSVNHAWSTFAEENGAEALSSGVVGTLLWDWIAGGEVRHLYKLLFGRVRERQEVSRIRFRCDSPTLRRFMELEIAPDAAGGLRCRAELKRTSARAAVLLLESGIQRSDALLAICSWCKRVRVEPDVWLEIEEATSRLGLLEDVPPSITHTICDPCATHLELGG